MTDSLTKAPLGKLTGKDATMARILKTAPWLAIPIFSLPAPLVFLILFITATTTETAALLLLLSGFSLAVGFALGLVVLSILLVYRRTWLANLRERLASDGITANEVVWFKSELTTAEKKSMAEIQKTNPILADAYMETLASRLTAARVLSRSKREILKVERRINRARMLGESNTAALQEELLDDRNRLEKLRENANQHLLKAKTRLQVIEATASRKLSQEDTNLMMERLGSQDQLPLVLEIAQLEQQALREVTASNIKELP